MALNADARSSESSTGLLSTMRLGKYRIERQLGAGGMGTVFLALDTELRRTVALKVLPKERAANPQLVRRFKSEGQAAARLEHENIVKVFEAGELDGHLYIALEYIDGIDVQELVRKRGMLPVRRSVEIVIQVAAALQHAYERGIVHRDIKPSNLLIRKDGVVKLADMGLARAIDETVESSITHAGMTVGTVDYISPEQGSDSKQADTRSDLYSLGCSWFHMLTGEVPYPDGTAVEKLRAHGTARIPDPRTYNDRIPAAIVAVLQRLMSKKPEARYQTPQDLINDLKQPSILRHETGVADIRGLALAASEVESEEIEPTSGPEIEPITGIDRTRPKKNNKADKRAQRRDVRQSERADDHIPPEPDSADPRRAVVRKANTRPAEQRAATRSEGKAKKGSPTPETKPKRDLPPRAERPARFAANQSMIDPDRLKKVGFGLLALVVLAAVGWMIWQATKDHGGSPVPSGANPFVRAEDSSLPPAPRAVPKVSKAAPAATPSAEVTNFRPADPFPGARDITGDSGASDVPRWVYEARELDRAQSPTVSVDPTGADHRTIDAALAALPPTGGILELHGRGPFAIYDLSLPAGQDVLLRAADGSQPVLLLVDADSHIGLSGARLELDGVHIVASGRGRNANAPLIDSVASTVLIRNSSIILGDPAPAPVPALLLQASAGTPSRCVIENVTLRGSNLTVASLRGPGQEFVAGNCFLDSGAAPAFSVVEPAGDTVDPATATAIVEVLQSIIISHTAAFQCEQRSAAPTPTVRLRVRHSILEGSGAEASALRFPAWPETSASVLDQPRATGVRIASEHSLWTGWPLLTVFRPAAGGDSISVETDAQWLQFWRSPLGSNSRPPSLEPPAGESSQRVDVSAELSRLAQALGLEARLETYLDSAALPQQPESLIARLVADSARPRVPENLDTLFSGQKFELDLSKNGLKLNRVLNSPEYPDGSRIVLKATKKVVIEPVVLKGKSLRVEFDTGNDPMLIEPRTLTGVDRPDALFRVEGGRLDLVNARLRIPPSESSSHPLRLLKVVNGSFAVRSSILLGQVGTAAEDVPTIEWDGGDDPSQFGLIEDSLVAGQSQAIGGQLRGQLLDVTNSIIVSGGDGLRFVVAPAIDPGTVHVSHGTLSAAAAFFRFEPPAEGPAGRLQVFVDESVYGPPATESGGLALLLQQAQGNRTAGVDWWETRTAVSDRIQRFRVADNARTATQDVNDIWVRGWGPDHVIDTVSGPFSVILTGQIDLAKPQPADFQLDAKSAAATAAADGGPLGARIESVGPGTPGAAAPGKSKSPARKTPAKPRGEGGINF